MKQLILGSVVGHLALALRDKLDLLRSALYNLEAVSVMANDHLALRLIARICAPSKVFIDVGAHIGSVMSEVHRHDKSIHVVAIEAVPEKVSKLRRVFPYAEVHQCAAGDSDGQASFFINVLHSGYSSLSRPSGGLFKEIRTPVRMIDSIVPSGEVDAMKIDVEAGDGGARQIAVPADCVHFPLHLSRARLSHRDEIHPHGNLSL